ncbi:SMI1/KNR4 family protein OS=Lysinibacillus sphaericus OX=1421 GN=LS41612_13375 PE=4 SV=1 [Lysinibacillus sphaericus]
MKQLEKSIFKFIEALNEYPKEDFPLKKTEESVIGSKLAKLDVDEKIYLSPELILFYQQCEIICNIRPDGYQLDCTDIDLGNSLLFLYAADKLVRRQEGFRWIGTEKKENPNWNPNWLVVADKDDDPIVVVTNQENSPVFASYETSALFPIADSFSVFLDALSVTLEIIHEKFKGEIMDEETFEIYDDFVEKLKSSLISILKKEEYADNLIDYLYG